MEKICIKYRDYMRKDLKKQTNFEVKFSNSEQIKQAIMIDKNDDLDFEN